MTDSILEDIIDEALEKITTPGLELSAVMKEISEEQPAYLAFITQDEIDLLVDEEHMHYYLLMTLAWLLRKSVDAIDPSEFENAEEALWGASEKKGWEDEVDVPDAILDALDDVLEETNFVSDVDRLLRVHFLTSYQVLSRV